MNQNAIDSGSSGDSAGVGIVLGRKLTATQPDANRDEFECGEEILGDLVVTKRDAALIFDFAEEALDGVARLIKMFAEADRVFER